VQDGRYRLNDDFFSVENLINNDSKGVRANLGDDNECFIINDLLFFFSVFNFSNNLFNNIFLNRPFAFGHLLLFLVLVLGLRY